VVTTPTITRPDAGTSTSPLPDVDLNAVPCCELGDECCGEHGPAEARLRFEHRCDHVETLLICGPCLERTAYYMSVPVPLRLHCPTCSDSHVCALFIHAGVLPL
jgi:hypothetical protein